MPSQPHEEIPETPRVRALRLVLEERDRKRRAEGIAEGRLEGLAEGLAEGRVEGLAEGETKGKQEALLTLLHARGIAFSPADEARVRACHELAQLDRWIACAATASSLDEVLGASLKPARAARTSRSVKAKAAKKPRASL